RYQQFICKICLCVDKASFSSYAVPYQRAFKRCSRTIPRETKCREAGCLFGSAREELGNFEGRSKSECALAGLEAEAGCRYWLSETAIDRRGSVGERRGGDSASRLS